MATNDFTDIKVYWDASVTGNIEVGNADTTISRSSAWVIAVEWEIIPSLTRAATFSTGIKTFLAGMFALRNVANTFSAFFTNTNTADRTYTLPDKNGTVAMTSDITGTNSWTNTGDQTSIVWITGTLAQFNTAITDADLATWWGTATWANTGDETLATIKSKLGITTLSWSNTWDQTSIVWLTGTKAQFNAALTDGDFNFSSIWYSAISTSSAITVWNLYWVDCTTWNIILTLSSGTTVGETLTVKKVDNSRNTITINSIWIDWSTSVIIDTQDESLDLFWNGTSFLII